MEKVKNLIKHVNIEGENNDMIDGFEKIVDHVISFDDLKLLVKHEISKLRETVKDGDVNWTENEQEELKKLLFNILIKNDISPEQKIKLLLDVLEHKIKNELRELDISSLKKPSEIILKIKNNNQITEYGIISDTYEGNSNYLVIILPIEHINYFLENSKDIPEESIYYLLNQNFNLTGIINGLVSSGLSKVYGFEGGDFEEISGDLPYGIDKKYTQLFDRYNELKKIPGENNEELKALERELVYLGAFYVYPEYQHKENLLSYGIENMDNFNLLIDTKEIFGYMLSLDYENINIKEQVKLFLNKKTKEYKEKKGGTGNNKYLKLLEDVLKPKGFENMTLKEYLYNIIKSHIYYKHKKRNIDIVANIETLQDNTTPNGIILKLGSSHFSELEKTGIPEVDDQIVPSLEIKNIKELLKEKKISFIEIKPKTK